MVAVARGAAGAVSLPLSMHKQSCHRTANVLLHFDDLSVVQVRFGYEFDTRQEGDEDIECQSIDTMESLVQHSKQLTPTARRWRKAVLIAARGAAKQASEATTDYTPRTPVARALQIAKPDIFAKALRSWQIKIQRVETEQPAECVRPASQPNLANPPLCEATVHDGRHGALRQD